MRFSRTARVMVSTFVKADVAAYGAMVALALLALLLGKAG
jgi:hypothetical protein